MPMTDDVLPGDLVHVDIAGEAEVRLFEDMVAERILQNETLEDVGVDVRDYLELDRDEFPGLWNEVHRFEEQHKQRVDRLTSYIGTQLDPAAPGYLDIHEDEFLDELYGGRDRLADQMASIEQELVDNYLLFFDHPYDVDTDTLWAEKDLDSVDLLQVREEHSKLVAGYLFMRARVYEFEQYLQNDPEGVISRTTGTETPYDTTVTELVEAQVADAIADYTSMDYDWEIDPVYNTTPVRMKIEE